MHLGAEWITNPFSVFATRNHANVFANPLVALLAVFEHSRLREVVTLTSIFYSLPSPNGAAVFSKAGWARCPSSLPQRAECSLSQFLAEAASLVPALGPFVRQSQPR